MNSEGRTAGVERRTFRFTGCDVLVPPHRCPAPWAAPPNLLRRLESNRHPVPDAVRAYLGAGLVFRGLVLLLTDVGLQQFADGAAPSLSISGLATYVMAA